MLYSCVSHIFIIRSLLQLFGHPLLGGFLYQLCGKTFLLVYKDQDCLQGHQPYTLQMPHGYSTLQLFHLWDKHLVVQVHKSIPRIFMFYSMFSYFSLQDQITRFIFYLINCTNINLLEYWLYLILAA